MGASPDEDDLADLIALYREVVDRPSPEHSLKGAEHLSLPEFLKGQYRGWTFEERLRLDHSPYAAHLQKLAWRVEPPSLETLCRWHVGTLHGFEAQAMKAHLAEPEGRPSLLLLNSKWWRRLMKFRDRQLSGYLFGRRSERQMLGQDLHDYLAHAYGWLPLPGLSQAGGTELRAGNPATLLVILRPVEDGRLELSFRSRDPAWAGQRVEVQLIGSSGAVSATVTLEAREEGGGSAALHYFKDNLTQLADRLGDTICLVANHANWRLAASPIDAKEYAISKIFSDDFAFELSYSQEPYSWTTDQAGELLDDLLEQLAGDPKTPVAELSPYFLGSIRLKKEENRSDATVVDGKAWLTTLTLLLSALKETIENRTVAEDLTPLLYGKGNQALGTSDRYRLLVHFVVPNPRSREQSVQGFSDDFFQEHFQQPGGLMKLAQSDTTIVGNSGQEKLRANGLYLLERLKALDEETRQRLTTFLLSRCSLVVASSPTAEENSLDRNDGGTAL